MVMEGHWWADLLDGNPGSRMAAAVAVIFVLLYWRSLPFVYHLRFLFYVALGKWRGRCAKRPANVQEESTLSFRVYPDDVDFNLHMGNSSYNKLCDFARYYHFCALGFGQISGANGGVVSAVYPSCTPEHNHQ